jgi:N-acetyl-1-D-myo-inositol-2-amino-2-deoxy-alpha-D-glucopyranoside deacetylase
MGMSNRELTLMAVHAHPDDEAIGTGGVLAKYSARGVRTVVVYATQGEAGEILNPEFVPASPGLDIEDIRARELAEALKLLKVESVFFLGYRDSGMVGAPGNLDPRAFIQADMDQAAGKLVKIIRSARPDVVVTYNEKGIYGHPDHVMAHRITVAAFHAAGDPARYREDGLEPWQPSKLYFIVIPRSRLLKMQEFLNATGEEPGFDPDFLGTPDEKITTRIDVREYLPVKLKALFSHRSQMGPDSFFKRMPEEYREEAFGFEHFICADGLVPPGHKEADLFEGLST